MRIASFPTYPSDQETRTATFQMLDRVAHDSSRLFVLIGVSSTARLANTIADWAEPLKGTPTSTIVLYSLQTLASEFAFCQLNLPDYRHFAPDEQCDLCKADSHALAIQTTNFMIGYARPRTVALPPAFFDEQKVFLEKWGHVDGALKVHFKDPNESSPRHHAFYVDIGILLDQELFVEEVFKHVNALTPRPEVVVIPDHPTSRRIAQVVTEKFGWQVAVVGNSPAQGVLNNAEGLATASSVLVIDDVFISGSRLDTINRIFRERRTELVPAATNVHFFTLLATPGSKKAYDRRRIGMTRNHGWTSRLSHLYQFALPDWHTVEKCPWCREREALNLVTKAAGLLDGAVSERLSVLSDATSGLTSTALFVADEQTAIPPLGGNSVLLREGSSAMQILFSCASAVQQARHAADALDATQFPVPSFLAERVFFENYTERLIWLGLLRSLRSDECEVPLKARLRAEALGEDTQQAELIRAELAVAWLCGKLGNIDDSGATRTFFSELGIEWEALQKTRFVVAPPPASAAAQQPPTGAGA